MVPYPTTKPLLILVLSYCCLLQRNLAEANIFSSSTAQCEDSTGKFQVEGVDKKKKCSKWANKSRCSKFPETKEKCPRTCGECGCIDTTKPFQVKIDGKTWTITCADVLKANGKPKKAVCNKIGDDFCPVSCGSSVCNGDDDGFDDDDSDCSDDKGTFKLKGKEVKCSDGSSSCNKKKFYNKCSKTCGFCDCQDFSGSFTLDGESLTCAKGINSNGGPKKKFCKQDAFSQLCPKACGKCGDNVPPTPPPTLRPTPSPTVEPGRPTKTPTSIPSEQPSLVPSSGPTVMAPTSAPTSSFYPTPTLQTPAPTPSNMPPPTLYPTWPPFQTPAPTPSNMPPPTLYPTMPPIQSPAPTPSSMFPPTWSPVQTPAPTPSNIPPPTLYPTMPPIQTPAPTPSNIPPPTPYPTFSPNFQDFQESAAPVA